jgi:glycosyltransferase involved in cell wall biosynthesis
MGGVQRPRIAIAHDHLTQRGGAERVVLAMSRAFPEAPIYTLLHDPSATYPEFSGKDVRVSALNSLTPLRRNHRAALPFLPLAASSMFVDADVVLTSSSGWAHGFRTDGHKLVHCHTPARYGHEHYVGEGGGGFPRHVAHRAMSRYLRQWDNHAAASCDRYLAVSSVVQQRIAEVYGIEAGVLPPPVAMSENDPVEPLPDAVHWLSESWADGAGFYLCVARLLPYKNVDAVVRAFAMNGRPLVVVGSGPELARINRLTTANVLVVADISDARLNWLYRECRAVVAASYEDYGWSPIEAAVWGRPTIALRGGGYLDTVDDGITGIFFDRPTSDAIVDAVDRFESVAFESDKIRWHVEKFGERRYTDSLHAAVDELVAP